MAKAKSPRIRKTETSGKLEKAKKARTKKVGRKIKSPFSKLFSIFGKEYHPIKMPDNKMGRFLTKRRSLIPGFLRGAFSEIRQTTWPGRRETLRLTWAVFVFAIIFSIIVAILDLILDKIFKSIILG